MNKNIKIRKAAVEKERLYALTDSLTGTGNRRAGIEYLNKLVEQSNEESMSISVCFIDVNNLKKVNDSFGHGEGDELLKNICSLVASKIREVDLLCRFGGDEFLIIFKNVGLKIAAHTMDRINEIIMDYNQMGRKPYPISISFGLAQYGQDGCKTIDKLIERADNEMYKNKMSYKERM